MNYSKIEIPLYLNIYWHNQNEEMRICATKLYNFFLRNENNPLDRHLGIPVYFYPFPPRISALEFNDISYVVHIFLIDDQMNLSEDWMKFAEGLIQKSKNQLENIIIPVALNEHSLNFTDKIHPNKFIRLDEIEKERKMIFLLIRLTHELCRLVYPSETVQGKTNQHPSINLFLSHSKDEGSKMASKLKLQIDKYPLLSSFFDTYIIHNYSEFSEELEKQIKRSVMVVILTDDFSSQNSGKTNVLLAKKHNRPVIIVNQYEKGESRSFPYLGNVPHIHYLEKWTDENKDVTLFDKIIVEALREALKTKYQQLKIDMLAKAFGWKLDTILSYPPELLSLAYLKNKSSGTVLYPDPPLGKAELKLLRMVRSDLDFITPTLLPLFSKKSGFIEFLRDQHVAISLSETDDSENVWIQNRAIQDLMVEISRYLLVSGAKLIYSGNINYQSKREGFNFSKLLIELVKTYQQDFEDVSNDPIQSVDNYSAYPIYTLISESQLAGLKNQVNFIKVLPPEQLEIKNPKELGEYFLGFDNFKKKYVWAKSLSKMRLTMITNSNALIVLGGKWVGFKGKMPGVLEEILIALKSNKPIYLIGAFGGVAKGVADALKGKKVKQLQSSFYKTQYNDYIEFLQQYNIYEKEHKRERVDYNAISIFLKGLSKNKNPFGLNNGLSLDENKRLFETRNEVEILRLILKGLKNKTK